MTSESIDERLFNFEKLFLYSVDTKAIAGSVKRFKTIDIDKNYQKSLYHETFFSSNKSELQVKSFRSKSCPKLKGSHIHRDNSNNSSFILNQENEEDSESSFDNERNKKKEEVETIRINLLQNTCSINKKNIGNNSSNNLNNLTSNNNKIIHSNASTSSFGRNFILKSDVCKSSISNYHNRYQDEAGNPLCDVKMNLKLKEIKNTF